MGGITAYLVEVWQTLLSQPSAPSTVLITIGAATLMTVAICFAAFSNPSGVGNAATFTQKLFGCYVRVGRVRNLLCSPCDRARKVYPMANTCQVPHFRSLSDIYNFVFGYKSDGLFVEVNLHRVWLSLACNQTLTFSAAGGRL
jgi:hypothetical protein